MAVEHQTDHATALANREVERLKHNDDWIALMGVVVSAIQELEDNGFWALFASGWLEGAGYQLDQLGDLLNEPRSGATDAYYLPRLRAKIRVLRSSGGPLDILQIFKLLLPNTTLYYSILGGANYILELGAVNAGHDGLSGNVPTYRRFAKIATTAGVGWNLHYESDSQTIFSLDAGTTLTSPITATDTHYTGNAYSSFADGDLITVGWGLSNAENRVLTVAKTGTVGAAFSNNHVASTAVSRVAAAGQFVTLSSSAASGQPTIHFTSIGKSYSPFTSFILSPGTSIEERRTVSSSTTTSLTFTTNLANTHASGSFACVDPFTGLGSETGGDSDDSGGAFSGIIAGS